MHSFSTILEKNKYTKMNRWLLLWPKTKKLLSDEALAKQLQEEFDNETPLKPEKKVIKPWKTANSSKGRGQTSVTPNEVPKEKVPKPDVKPNIDVQEIVAEIKENLVADVKHSVSKEVVSIFQRMFSCDMQSAMVMLKSKEVHAALGMLSEIGSAPETSKTKQQTCDPLKRKEMTSVAGDRTMGPETDLNKNQQSAQAETGLSMIEQGGELRTFISQWTRCFIFLFCQWLWRGGNV